MDLKKIKESDFKPQALKEAENYFKNVHMTQEQHGIFNDFVEIFLRYVPLDSIAAKGIGWKAVKTWQLKHKRDLLGLVDENPENRISSIYNLLQIVKEELIQILENKDDASKVDTAISEIMDFYKDKYAYR